MYKLSFSLLVLPSWQFSHKKLAKSSMPMLGVNLTTQGRFHKQFCTLHRSFGPYAKLLRSFCSIKVGQRHRVWMGRAISMIYTQGPTFMKSTPSRNNQNLLIEIFYFSLENWIMFDLRRKIKQNWIITGLGALKL